MSINLDEYLEQVLESHKMKHVDGLLQKYIVKREIVKNALALKFKDQIVSRAINSGSYAKHDAINTKFDLDLCQPFKRNSFQTLEEMANEVSAYFENEFEDTDFLKHRTRRQRVSTGISFLIEHTEINMDIVPGRELALGDYSETNRLNLYVRPKFPQSESTTQTNIQKHIDHIKGKKEERKAIRHLKIWKTNKIYTPIKSFYLELITIKAFESCPEIPVGNWAQLKMVLEFIRDNIKSIKLTDIANSNNVVSDTMTDSEKQNLHQEIKTLLDIISNSPENIKTYFPINFDFHSESHITKVAAALEISRSGIIQKPWCLFQ